MGGFREVRLYLGPTGSGKTHLMRQHLAGVTRSLVLDADLAELPGTRYDDFEALANALDSRSVPGGFFRAVYTPRPWDYPAVFALAYDCAPMALVLEEADRFGNPKDNEEYWNAIVRGRHQGLSIWAASLYPSMLPIELRSQASYMAIFKQSEPAHVEWIAKKIGKADAAQLETLNYQAHEKLIWTQQDGARKIGA